MHKVEPSQEPKYLPDLGGMLTVPLYSVDGSEEFKLDIRRNKIRLTKSTYQTRAQSIFVLARLDIGGAPHRNPDGQEIACPHIHFYREGYGDKWAVDATHMVAACNDNFQVLQWFMARCNIVQPPNFQMGLFG
jgi:hypothetical protein